MILRLEKIQYVLVRRDAIKIFVSGRNMFALFPFFGNDYRLGPQSAIDSMSIVLQMLQNLLKTGEPCITGESIEGGLQICVGDYFIDERPSGLNGPLTVDCELEPEFFHEFGKWPFEITGYLPRIMSSRSMSDFICF